MKLPVLLLASIAITACFSFRNQHGNAIDVKSVPTEAGLVSGYAGDNGIVKIFKGIPFAAPPVGELRWKAPAPVVKWEGIRKCEVFSASAIQAKPAPFAMWSKEFMAPESPLSEDCLYLNVWTAANNTDEKRPVIVYIHGGAFTGGSGSVPLYDGEEMAKKGVVFVTINYRLGIFGFLAHPDLSKESPDGVSGNYGILDQIEALRWVNRNIAAFGGDPTNVTIEGQSAGAFSVNALVVSPKAKGLFRKAIAESGGIFGGDRMLTSGLKNGENAGVKLSEKLKSTIAEMRKLPAETLLNAGTAGPVIDGVVILPADETFNSSAQNDVALITGWNADEFNFGPPAKAASFKQEASRRYGNYSEEMLKYFPAETDEQANQSQKLLSVLSFGWQNYRWASLQSGKGKNKAWLYIFSHVPPGEPNYGAFHSAEFGYCLNNLKYWDRPFTEADYKLADMMSSYWVNFAKTGNPNGDGLPEWPVFNSADPRLIEFGDQVKSGDLPHRPQLEFLNRYQESLMSKD